MQTLCAWLRLLGLFVQLANAEAFIGFDGKEHRYPTHRDGLHDPAIHHHYHNWVTRMLNGHRSPIIVNQRDLHITVRGHRITHNRFGAGMSPGVQNDNLGKAVPRGSHAAQEHVRFHGGYDDNKYFTIKDDQTSVANGPSAADSPAAAGPAPAPAPMAAPAQSGDSPFTMDEGLGAPEQGFAGETVEHNNMKTMTDDWHGEYGPGAEGLQSYYKICALYPDNKWCHLRGYHRTTPKPNSGSVQVAGSSTVMTLVVVAYGVFLA